jgi:hypothetical protein
MMTFRRYTHDDAAYVSKLMQWFCKEHRLKIHTGVYNDGMTLGLVVANRDKVSRLYEFGMVGKTADSPGTPGPALSDVGLLKIVQEWSTGEPRPPEKVPTETAPTEDPTAKEFTTRDAFAAWFRDAKPGAKAIYYRGSIAHFRHDAPARIIALQQLQDNAKPAKPRPVSESLELQQIQDSLDLIQHATYLYHQGLALLTQRKSVEGDTTIHYAVKKAT